MAGTGTNRSEEFARVNRSESNNYYSGTTDSKSPMKSGFKPAHKAKDPAATSAGTEKPNGR